mmetsp:Transcript_13769/g.19387  ORF Transcript_13769/g.19387 Transcript_13769/m.19387 type:complete len:588 (-) Transcript_13769:123-1886(-)
MKATAIPFVLSLTTILRVASFSPAVSHHTRPFLKKIQTKSTTFVVRKNWSKDALFMSDGAVGLEEATLPDIFPALSESLHSLGFSTPTPIQSASAAKAVDGENLLLIAPTGSGKTLAYLLPALSKAITEDKTVLCVAPTRELAVQLMRDSLSLLSVLSNDAESAVLLAVRGADIPTPAELSTATMIIGTPQELNIVLTNVGGGYEFLAGDTLSTVVLDEVDVLLPLPPKQLRTALDKGRDKPKKDRNTPQDERRRQEQRRKLMAAKRKGTEINDSKQIITQTEKLLNLIASCRFAGGEDAMPPQILAGSATASRKTLDRLNRAMRNAAEEASSTFDLVWSKDIKACRPEGDTQKEGEEHTIRTVTVPSQVDHRYVCLPKESASSPASVLTAVANAAKVLKPKTALVFLCGEFGKANIKAKEVAKAKPSGATSKARRNSMLKNKKMASKAEMKDKAKSPTAVLSARKTCAILEKLGIDAQPLHVALGLELNVKEGDETIETPPFLVTFEGSARGLHFDGVDAVFVVGRPASAASYLHLAGRVGRASTSDGNVVIKPGTVVSVCTKGSATELDKWTRQIGGSALEELVL